ncbi:MAG TPA: hypothetical protein VKB19_05200 [Pedobacter sp.]|nr:hypothetical protein [Pedobacter sp.]
MKKEIVSGVALTLLFSVVMALANSVFGQNNQSYKVLQDTVLKKRQPAESLNIYHEETSPLLDDSRLLGAAVKAARMLADTSNYDPVKGIGISTLFSKSDLSYFASRGIANIISLFVVINKYLPPGQKLDFLTDSVQTGIVIENPLILRSLKMRISATFASTTPDSLQWKENVYHAYLARDYGTSLNNTITVMAATTEMRERSDLELIDYDGSPITLGQILNEKIGKGKKATILESAAILAFRLRTFPSSRMKKEYANENYKRALLTLISLHERDFRTHTETSSLLAALKMDLTRGDASAVIAGLKASNFFDANVPGNIGPVLLTQSTLLNAVEVASHAETKALELVTLTTLHYGERDAVKLMTRLINGQGWMDAQESGDFSVKRLGQLRFHGVEKFKSLGFGSDKTAQMTIADLVLVAVAAPEVPAGFSPKTALTVLNIGRSIISNYSTILAQETSNTIQLNPRISLGTRHIEHRAAYDAVDYVPELLNGEDIGQRGSKINYSGLELRLESDIYFSNLKKMLDRALKPWFFPEFGVIIGTGTRKVGYDLTTIVGRHGAVPKFNQRYGNWGGHVGLNIGPVVLAADGTILSTADMASPNEKFFDLSQAMTYFRYSMLIHAVNYRLTKSATPCNLIFDLEVAGETNNEGVFDRTRTQNTSFQTGSGEWQKDFDRAHPNGNYNDEIAKSMILNGDVKAAYAASNFAAAHIGFRRSGFQVKITGGLYNLTAIQGRGEGSGQWLNRLFINTSKGNFFSGLTLTYHFGSHKSTEKYHRSERFSKVDDKNSLPEIAESTESIHSILDLQNRSIFNNAGK